MMADAARRPPTDRPGPAPQRAAHVPPTRRIDSRELLGADNEIEIDHAGHIYRLRRTSLGKLILTK